MRITIIYSIALSFTLLVAAQEALTQDKKDSSVSRPPKTELVETHTVRLGGRDIFSSRYMSVLPMDEVMRYYKDFFIDAGFNIILNRESSQQKFLRFKKDDAVVNVMVMSKEGGTQLVISEYAQPPGMPSLEETRPSWQELMALLPKEDQPGQDLEFIPRPPESIRLLYLPRNGTIHLVYSSAKPVEEVRVFYKNHMYYQGWQMERETTMQDAAKAMKQAGKNPKLPFPDVTLEQFIAGGYTLDFTGYWGKTHVVVLPNALTGESKGSFIQIRYVEE